MDNTATSKNPDEIQCAIQNIKKQILENLHHFVYNEDLKEPKNIVKIHGALTRRVYLLIPVTTIMSNKNQSACLNHTLHICCLI